MKSICRLFFFIACCYIAQVSDVYASDREIALKAGLIFNFAVYSKGGWFDPEIDKNYIICSTDSDFVRVARKTLKNKKIRNSYVVVQYLSVDNIRNHHCKSIFFSANMNDVLKSNSLTGDYKGAMLIGEFDGFIERGGHINFFLAAGKVRFELDPDGLHNSDIDISSKVIRSGEVITRGRNE
jgi:hypothetical protein